MIKAIYILLLLPVFITGQILPDAVGYAAGIDGGRGDNITFVTNLNDSGVGSFRSAVAVDNTNVVFLVAGTIEAQSTITITGDNISIWGSTATRNGGGGILVRKSPTSSFADVCVNVNANNVFIEGIRVRSGAHTSTESSGDAFASFSGSTSNRLNGLYVRNSSFSWGTDEVVNFNFHDNITLDRVVITEGLYSSVHPSGNHSRGLFFYGCENVSVYKTLVSQSNQRNPLVGGDSDPGENYEYLNLMVYNPGAFGSIFENNSQAFNVNIEHSFWKGLSTNTPNPGGPVTSSTRYRIGVQEGASSLYYVEGILCDLYRPSLSNGSDWDAVGQGSTLNANASTAFQSLTPFAYPMQSVTDFYTADNLVSQMLPEIGALPHDAVDVRVLDDAANGTGGIIDDPSQVGGWPTIAAMGSVPPDTDGDGMPDAYETANSLDPNNAADGPTIVNGFSNFERYAHTLMNLSGAPPTATGDIVKKKNAFGFFN